MSKLGKLEEFLTEAERQLLFVPNTALGEDVDELVSHAIDTIRNLTTDSFGCMRQIHNLQAMIHQALSSVGQFILNV